MPDFRTLIFADRCPLDLVDVDGSDAECGQRNGHGRAADRHRPDRNRRYRALPLRRGRSHLIQVSRA